MIMSELPEDLLEEILCRVPAASLKRLQSTCKRWNRLFNDRRFARKQLDKAAAKPSSLILVLKDLRVCSMSINLHRVPSLELLGEHALIHPRSRFGQAEIYRVSHCDGLLLCTTECYMPRLVVWNPCTGQTTWININHHSKYTTYALGSYQDKKSSDNISYKILSHNGCYYGPNQEFGIYDINSNSWRILDVTIDFGLTGVLNRGVSLKGKTYWIARDKEEEHIDKDLLVSFDYTKERFERLCLPSQDPSFMNVSLSVVRDEKLSVFFQRDRTEIWVTNKIGDETKVVSWSMVLAVDLGPRFVICYSGSFWIDEEKKVLLCCDESVRNDKKIHVVGEDHKLRTEDLEVGSCTLLVHVPSLIQI